MIHWVHHGCVTPGFAKWVTTAEQVDGKTFIYYDFPNDQDPHLFIDEDLTDGKPGKNMGLALNDPSDGSDCAVIRDINGKFHIIFEDWSPINARKHSWDSPSPAMPSAPTGSTGTPSWLPPWTSVPSPPARWPNTHPHWKGRIPSVSRATSPNMRSTNPSRTLTETGRPFPSAGSTTSFATFTPHTRNPDRLVHVLEHRQALFLLREIGKGHPDPDIGFAEGRFYLVTQTANDYVSPGPWVEKVEARVGVDTDKDGKVNRWTKWQETKENYEYVKGFSKQVAKTPAKLDLSDLPEGFGFKSS